MFRTSCRTYPVVLKEIGHETGLARHQRRTTQQQRRDARNRLIVFLIKALTSAIGTPHQKFSRTSRQE